MQAMILTCPAQRSQVSISMCLVVDGIKEHDYLDTQLPGPRFANASTIRIGQRVMVRLAEAAPITGGLLFELLEVDGRKLPTPPRRGVKSPKGRKLARQRIKRAKSAKRDARRH